MENLNQFFDHTVLKPDAKKSDIEKICDEAKKYQFFSVCVNPCHIQFSAECLKGTAVKIATVVGFPLGANTTEAKVYETKNAIENGADEIDMVINIGALKDNDADYVLKDIQEVAKQCAKKTLLKVILETCLLTKEEIELACRLSMEAGADYVKTSTGFSTGGARVEDIEIMKSVVGNHLGIKASGGIRDLETTLKMIEAGATRIGASASVSIMKAHKA